MDRILNRNDEKMSSLSQKLSSEYNPTCLEFVLEESAKEPCIVPPMFEDSLSSSGEDLWNEATDKNVPSNDAKIKPGKKTRGRVRIQMEFIKDKVRRYTTFSKRKTGIMKKAYELAQLTGTQLMILVASETGHVYTYATSKLKPMITSSEGKAMINHCLSSESSSPSSAPDDFLTYRPAIKRNHEGRAQGEVPLKKFSSSAISPSKEDNTYSSIVPMDLSKQVMQEPIDEKPFVLSARASDKSISNHEFLTLFEHSDPLSS